MPKRKSAFRRLRTEKKSYLYNTSIKSGIKTLTKKVLNVKDENKEQKLDLVKNAISKIDKAVKKGVLHKNTANRKKSKLMKSTLK